MEQAESVVSEIKLTDSQLDIIAHSLGVRYYDAKLSNNPKNKILPDEFYRNYFSYGNSESFSSEMQELKEMGLIIQFSKFGNECFRVTDKGISELRRLFKLEVTDKYVRPSKSRKKYLDYLDADCGLTFREYLNISAPKRVEDRGHIRFLSTKYYNVEGEWKRTIKEAKATYKVALAQHKKQLKEYQKEISTQ